MEEIKQILEKMREEIVNNIMEEREKSKTAKTNDIGDEADHVIEERTQEMHRLFSNRDVRKLQSIDNALDRIKNGEYGICEECGEDISHKRLMAVPFTRLCFECQSNEEISGSSSMDRSDDMDYFSDTGDDSKD